jgi:hypothetical protein
MNIPTTVSGRPVTNRGVHGPPFGHSGAWCSPKPIRDYWLKLMQSMGMSWFMLITDGDSCLTKFDGKAVVTWLLESGIIPLIRWQAPWDRPFTGADVARKLVPLYAPFGLRPFFQIYNEPGDDREVVNPLPNPWWTHFIARWVDAAHQVINAGALPGFPDGPGFDFQEMHPFRDTPPGYWLDGWAWYGVHNYGKGRPLDYPYDNVSRFGTQLTEAEYRAAPDDYADDPQWHDVSLDIINKARREQANPHLTALDDDVCWNAWRKVDHFAKEMLGHSVPMAMTEGGWQPRDRAGSGPNSDLRWPLTTPRKVAELTLAMFQADTPLFAQCPWLLACGDMGGSGWEYDSWVTWAYADKYGREKPVVRALQQTPPQERTLPQVMAEARGVAENFVGAAGEL